MLVNGNITNDTQIDFQNKSAAESSSAKELEPMAAMVVRISFSAFICITGIVGNIAVCIVTTCIRKRSAVNLYILNLAIADLGVLCICYPLTIVKSNDPLHWPLGKFVCKVIYPLSDIFYAASISSIVAIAIDRYRAIVLNMRSKNSLKTVRWLIPTVWIFSFLLVVFPLYFVMEYIEDTSNNTIDCTPRWPGLLLEQLYVSSLGLFFYILPLCCILWCYRRIAHQICQSKKLHKRILRQRNRKNLQRYRQRHRNQNSKALKILVPLVVLFAITMLPFHVFRLCLAFVPNFVKILPYPWLVFNVCIFLLLGNSSFNPIIYSIVSGEFRQSIKQALRMQCHLLTITESTIMALKSKSTTEDTTDRKSYLAITTSV